MSVIVIKNNKDTTFNELLFQLRPYLYIQFASIVEVQEHEEINGTFPPLYVTGPDNVIDQSGAICPSRSSDIAFL